VKLAVQRVYGSIFQIQMKSDSLELNEALGFSDDSSDKELFDLMYKMTGVFKARPQLNEELGT
jgi:hypothetical protein